MKKRSGLKIIPAILCIAAVLTLWPETAQASTWNNAVTYYNSYGNSVVFKATSSTDGLLYYGTRGKNATTTTTFSTVGWKMTIQNASGTTLQNIYYKLGGSYMTRVDSRSSSGYTYNLYSLSLYNIKRRMNAKATAAMESGSMNITLNACMVVVKKGKAQGAMTDSGPSSGKVYSTYSGIANAASWSSASKSSLNSYFNKTVTGLFYRITTSYDSGISSVSGGGTYFYGTYITLKAKVKSGYEFDKWTGTAKSSLASFSFYVNAAGKYKANSVKKKVEEKPSSGGDGGSSASTPSSSTSTYTPSTSTPSTSTPSTSTPSTQTPSTSTPSTSTPAEDSTETPKTEDNNTKKAVKLKVRFISSEYFEDESNNLVSSSKGGLASDSKWATDNTLRALLRSVLSK